MSTKRLEHLKEGEKIYLEVTRKYRDGDDEGSLYFDHPCCGSIWVSDDETFYFPDDLKQLTNDGMPNDNIPKQGEIIQVCNAGEEFVRKGKFVSFYDDKVIIFNPVEPFYSEWDSWRYPPKKTELTLAEVEEKLGLEKDSLIIKD